jgi:hypothetical protein
MLATPAGRLPSEERRDKYDYAQHHGDPQKYEGDNDDSNDYRSESFHYSPIVITSIERSVIDGTGHDDRRGRDRRQCGGVVPHLHAASVGAILVSRHHITM